MAAGSGRSGGSGAGAGAGASKPGHHHKNSHTSLGSSGDGGGPVGGTSMDGNPLAVFGGLIDYQARSAFCFAFHSQRHRASQEQEERGGVRCMGSRCLDAHAPSTLCGRPQESDVTYLMDVLECSGPDLVRAAYWDWGDFSDLWSQYVVSEPGAGEGERARLSIPLRRALQRGDPAYRAPGHVALLLWSRRLIRPWCS